MSNTGQDLNEIKDKYSLVWKQLKAKYPQASGGIHFAFKGEFVPVNDSFSGLLKKNPYVFADSQTKSKAQSLLKTNKDASEEDIKKLLLLAPLNPECRIEVLWNDLDYDLIAQMRVDLLVDLKLTPQTRASIRIVLGTIGEKS